MNSKINTYENKLKSVGQTYNHQEIDQAVSKYVEQYESDRETLSKYYIK